MRACGASSGSVMFGMGGGEEVNSPGWPKWQCVCVANTQFDGFYSMQGFRHLDVTTCMSIHQACKSPLPILSYAHLSDTNNIEG